MHCEHVSTVPPVQYLQPLMQGEQALAAELK